MSRIRSIRWAVCALLVVLLVTLQSRPPVGSCSPDGTTPRIGAPAAPSVPGEPEQAERGVDWDLYGTVVKVIPSGHEQTTLHSPTHATPFGRGRLALRLGTPRRC